MQYWQVDYNAIRHRCAGRGAVMARHPFPDFNAEGLRHGLPTSVALLDGAMRPCPSPPFCRTSDEPRSQGVVATPPRC